MSMSMKQLVKWMEANPVEAEIARQHYIKKVNEGKTAEELAIEKAQGDALLELMFPTTKGVK